MKKNIKKIIIILLLAIVAYCIFINIKKMQKEAYIKININGQEIKITQQDESQEYNLETLNTQYETKAKIELKNAQIKVNNQLIKNEKEINLGKLEIKEENKIKIEVKLIGQFKYKEYYINTMPKSLPQYETEGKSKQEGDYEYYITTYNFTKPGDKHYIYKINQNGELTFYKQTKEISYNFKKNIIDGKIRYTYLERTSLKYEGINDAAPAKLVVLDEKYNEIKRINYKIGEEQIDAECHDYYYLGENHYIIAGYTREKIKNVPTIENKALKIWNCRIQEVENDEIKWEFQAKDNEKIYSYFNQKYVTLERTNEYINNMYFNSMEIDPLDGNLICSFRVIDAIIKINRTTGKIMWILGGKGDEFGLTQEQKFSKQHSISYLSDHSILIYDNGEEEQKTRVIIVKLNEEKKQIEKYESYNLNIYAPRMGSIQKINEEEKTYLITYGSGKHESAFEEINIETLKVDFKFTIIGDNTLYCVNKY